MEKSNQSTVSQSCFKNKLIF